MNLNTLFSDTVIPVEFIATGSMKYQILNP
jgi:hypothetical protein